MSSSRYVCIRSRASSDYTDAHGIQIRSKSGCNCPDVHGNLAYVYKLNSTQITDVTHSHTRS